MSSSTDTNKVWVLPASIPFADLKGHDLEECVYWLMDSMGAKDLEWRVGGSGGGAADGGRDLEARFYSQTADGEIEAQQWWIECKGRAGTVEADEVKSAVSNALGISGLDYIVIATNTQFSNPTRDWVKVWQTKYPAPKIKLWDRSQLERYLSRHPDVVMRLFAEALSIEGRLKALESRFWNKLEFMGPHTLTDIWEARHELQFEPAEMFAVIANEFAVGRITDRAWGAILTISSLKQVLAVALFNIPYFTIRFSKTGIDQRPIRQTFSYLILATLDQLPSEEVATLIRSFLNRGEEELLPENFQNMLLAPVLDQLLAELGEVCSSDCRRVHLLTRDALTEGKDEVDDFWLRLEAEDGTRTKENRRIRLESHDEPCVVGFPVDKENGCPLFRLEPEVKNLENILAVIKGVISFRKMQADAKRQAMKQKVQANSSLTT